MEIAVNWFGGRAVLLRRLPRQSGSSARPLNSRRARLLASAVSVLGAQQRLPGLKPHRQLLPRLAR
jgi:hypothetical protein